MKRGFTLMELLITVAIMGILSTVGVGAFMTSFGKARDAQRKQDLNTLAKAIEVYASDFEEYPDDDGNGMILACEPHTDGVVETCDWGEAFVLIKGGQPVNYLDRMPSDPIGGVNYYYELEADGSFSLYSAMENTQDPYYSVWGINCGALDCNYKLTPVGPDKL